MFCLFYVRVAGIARQRPQIRVQDELSGVRPGRLVQIRQDHHVIAAHRHVSAKVSITRNAASITSRARCHVGQARGFVEGKRCDCTGRGKVECLAILAHELVGRKDGRACPGLWYRPGARRGLSDLGIRKCDWTRAAEQWDLKAARRWVVAPHLEDAPPELNPDYGPYKEHADGKRQHAGQGWKRSDHRDDNDLHAGHCRQGP